VEGCRRRLESIAQGAVGKFKLSVRQRADQNCGLAIANE
jgi:hypothetical protein